MQVRTARASLPCCAHSAMRSGRVPCRHGRTLSGTAGILVPAPAAVIRSACTAGPGASGCGLEQPAPAGPHYITLQRKLAEISFFRCIVYFRLCTDAVTGHRSGCPSPCRGAPRSFRAAAGFQHPHGWNMRHDHAVLQTGSSGFFQSTVLTFVPTCDIMMSQSYPSSARSHQQSHAGVVASPAPAQPDVIPGMHPQRRSYA